MRAMATALCSALLILGACASTAKETASVRAEEIKGVLRDHGFAPPTAIDAADSSTWVVSLRSGGSMRSVEQVVVRLPRNAAESTVEIQRFVKGPKDWATTGSLFNSDKTASEASAIHEKLMRRFAPK